MTSTSARSILAAALVALACRGSDQVGGASTGSARPAGQRLFAGGKRTCLVGGDRIRCWGDAAHGSLGPAVAMSAATVPTSLPGIETAVDIAFG